MSTATTPISEKSLQVLQQLAEETGMGILDMLDVAVEDYRCRMYVELVEKAGPSYQAMWVDPDLWPDELATNDPPEEPLVARLGPEDYWTGDGPHEVRDEELDEETA